jgi:hypothetical protein
MDMSSLIRTLIDRMNHQRLTLGKVREPVANPAMVSHLRDRLSSDQRYRVPTEVTELLLVADGFYINTLCWNACATRPITGRPDIGHVFGLIEDQEEHWDFTGRRWLVIALEEAYAYAYDQDRNTYFQFIASSRQAIRDYTSFAEMLADALDHAGVKVDDLIPTTFILSSSRRPQR